MVRNAAISILRQGGWSDVVRLIVFCCPLFSTLLSSGQNLNLSAALTCTAADFDANLGFVNGPGNYYTVVVNKRNISGHACLLDRPDGPTFAPDRVPGHAPYGICYYCEDRLPNGQTPVIPPVTVNPGQVARETIRWRTMSSNEAMPCLEPKSMWGPVLVVAPSLLKAVCSDVEVSRFRIAAPLETVPLELDQNDRVPAFDLTAEKNLYYAGEWFSLRVARAQTSLQISTNEGGCPVLYLRQRSPDGGTRIDEVRPLAFKGCGKPVLGYQLGDWRSGFDLPSGVNSQWSGVGEHLLEIFQLASSQDAPELCFAYSNVLRIQLADPSTIPRLWGPRVKGVATDVTLDKNTFHVGEDVPLHLAIEDFDSEAAIYTSDPVWDPCSVVAIEVEDAEGRPLPADERFPNSSICSGHGFGPRPFPKGKVIPLERTLRTEGWLPNRPGIYKVVITWTPCVGQRTDFPDGHYSGDLKPYAVVHASADIRVIDNDASQPKQEHRHER